jgi:hypothetical protein
MSKGSQFSALWAGTFLVFLASCASLETPRVVARDDGPPPHAPAHGRRAKSQASSEVQLVFDAGLGVYVVVDVPHTYYWEGVYLRIQDGRWMMSATFDGPWEAGKDVALPPGLAKKYAGKGKKKGHPGRGRGAAKGTW